MNIPWRILSAGLSCLILFAMFRPLEVAFPANPVQRVFRRYWLTDLFYLLGQYLFFNGAVLWALQWSQPWIHSAMPTGPRNWILSQSMWIQFPMVILIGDVLIYWGHRLQHRYDFLWRFHSIHHTAEHLDWLAAHREHPIDSLYTILLVNLPIFALGFSIQSLAYFAAFRGLWAILIHANVRFPLPPALRIVFGAPELHHWHHDRSRDSGNYANVSPLIDLLFGTYHCPPQEPEAFGTVEPIPQTYFRQMIYPFQKRRKSKESLTPSETRQSNNAQDVAGNLVARGQI